MIVYFMLLKLAKIADEIYREAAKLEGVRCIGLSKADYISVNPVLGIVIMSAITLAVTYGLLGLIHEIGHRMPSMIYYSFYEPFVGSLVEGIVPEGLLRDILVGEKAGIYGSLGLLTTGVFFVFFMILPTILLLYLVLGVLEDVGFLPRIAVSFHKPLCRLGLSGDATIPLVTGTGCSIVGVLSTRILRSDKERIIASLLHVLGVPCMAQQVMIWYVLGRYGLLYILALYLLSLLAMATLGFILNKIIPGENATILLEFPPWRKPKLKNLLKKSYFRVVAFLRTGVPLIFLGIFVVNLAYYMGTITAIASIFSPVMSGLFKLPSEACLALIISTLRKDVAVGILGGYELTPLQTLTAITVITLGFPCIGSFAVMLSEFRLKRVLEMTALMLIASLLIGSLLGFLIR